MDQTNMMTNEPPKKRAWLKWTLIGCGGLLVIGAILFGIGAWFIYNNASMSTDPATVEASAQEMLQFDKPEGYHGVMSGSMFGMKMAVIAAGDGSGTPSVDEGGIVLLTFPASMTSADAERQFRDGMMRQGDPSSEVKRTPETFLVRGEETTAAVTLNERNSKKTLQYTLSLKNAAGNTVLAIVGGPEATATHDWVQRILSTVK